MEQALIFFEKSLQIGRNLGDDTKIAWSLGNIGSAHICLGNCDSAIPLLLSAKAIFEQIKALIGVVFCLEELGLIALFRGEFDRAQTLADQAENLALDAGLSLDFHQRPTALKGMSRLMKGDLTRAITCFQDIETAGTPGLTTCLGTGFVSIVNQDACRAAFYEKKAKHLTKSVHKPQFIALSYLLQEAIFLQNKDKAAAASKLDLAMNAPLSPSKLFNAWPFADSLICQIRQV
ncbi:tetratricopeptide repeat protein [uncultured Desulfobacter sp.]|uniref:tetratricopeptide repeat protein n=1 Tax=uncultured Desulfobacter sp. TaxID=240139 RepID=UPI002AAC3299|nr:tetratricopeptide repeat protein [uncultured Desulfobacter sp.]